MPAAPLPSDPANWTDWRNPEAHGLTKVDCDTPPEQALFGGAVIFAMVAAVVLWDEYVAPFIHPRDAPLFAAAFAPRVVLSLVAGAFVLVGARAATDNFYLIDRARHVVYFHARFLWFRRVRVLLDRADVYTASVESNWGRDALWTANNEAKQLAQTLACQWFESPDGGQLIVRMKGDTPVVSFKAR